MRTAPLPLPERLEGQAKKEVHTRTISALCLGLCRWRLWTKSLSRPDPIPSHPRKDTSARGNPCFRWCLAMWWVASVKCRDVEAISPTLIPCALWLPSTVLNYRRHRELLISVMAWQTSKSTNIQHASHHKCEIAAPLHVPQATIARHRVDGHTCY